MGCDAEALVECQKLLESSLPSSELLAKLKEVLASHESTSDILNSFGGWRADLVSSLNSKELSQEKQNKTHVLQSGVLALYMTYSDFIERIKAKAAEKKRSKAERSMEREKREI